MDQPRPAPQDRRDTASSLHICSVQAARGFAASSRAPAQGAAPGELLTASSHLQTHQSRRFGLSCLEASHGLRPDALAPAASHPRRGARRHSALSVAPARGPSLAGAWTGELPPTRLSLPDASGPATTLSRCCAVWHPLSLFS